jgi:hypothetical protein
MKFISVKLHGYLDYTVALLLIVSPWVFGFYRGGAETIVPVAMGVFTMLYSLVTKYQLGVVPLISFRMHLTLDALQAVFLAISPMLFGFAYFVYWPHVIFAVGELAVVLATQTAAVPRTR